MHPLTRSTVAAAVAPYQLGIPRSKKQLLFRTPRQNKIVVLRSIDKQIRCVRRPGEQIRFIRIHRRTEIICLIPLGETTICLGPLGDKLLIQDASAEGHVFSPPPTNN